MQHTFKHSKFSFLVRFLKWTIIINKPYLYVPKHIPISQIKNAIWTCTNMFRLKCPTTWPLSEPTRRDSRKNYHGGVTIREYHLIRFFFAANAYSKIFFLNRNHDLEQLELDFFKYCGTFAKPIWPYIYQK